MSNTFDKHRRPRRKRAEHKQKCIGSNHRKKRPIALLCLKEHIHTKEEGDQCHLNAHSIGDAHIRPIAKKREIAGNEPGETVEDIKAPQTFPVRNKKINNRRRENNQKTEQENI